MTKRLGIKRSLLFEEAMRIAIREKAQTLSPGTTLEEFVAHHIAAEKRQGEAIALVQERMDQEEYARAKEAQRQEDTAQAILYEFGIFCTETCTTPEKVVAGIQGENYLDPVKTENTICARMRTAGLPNDPKVIIPIILARVR